MSVADQVYAQVRFMADETAAENEALLRVLCQTVVAALTARLREELTPEDCLSDFVTAAGMYTLAIMAETGDLTGVEQLTAGDMTLRRGSTNRGADRLRSQAELLMAPYLKSAFTFLGV